MNKVYKKVEVVGVSDASVTEAVQTAISRAAETIDNISWFEVQEIRGAVSEGKVAQFQVTVKIGFLVDPKS